MYERELGKHFIKVREKVKHLIVMEGSSSHAGSLVQIPVAFCMWDSLSELK